MGKLAEALKRKYKSPREALKALGLDELLLDVEKIAYDAKRRARDGALSDQDAEMRAARDLHDEEFEREQRRLDRGLEDAMVDDEEEVDPRRWLMHDHETEAPPDEELAARRRWWMKRAGDYMLAHGKDEAAVRDALADFPKTGLEHLGGALDEDVDTVMGRLEQMGSAATSGYPAKVTGDRRRRMAKDARLMGTQLGLDRLTPKRGDFCNWGDQPEPLAMDEADADDSEFYKMFPEARGLSTPG